MKRTIALTDVESRRTLVFSSPPWSLKGLKCGLGGCRVTLVHEDGRVRTIVTNAEERSVKARLKGW